VADGQFQPTLKMAAAARKGLRLHRKFNRGGTDVGLARAQQLVDQRNLDSDDVKSMHSYFARHEIDKDTHTHSWGSDSDPSAGYIAWLLWGGEAGKTWAAGKAKQLKG
jgi:hypothetical protein